VSNILVKNQEVNCANFLNLHIKSAYAVKIFKQCLQTVSSLGDQPLDLYLAFAPGKSPGLWVRAPL